MTRAGDTAPGERLPHHFPRVQGRCPACGSSSLFLGSEGYVTCSVIGCSDPCRASDVLDLPVVERAGGDEAARAKAIGAAAWTLGRTTHNGTDYDGPFNVEDYMAQAERVVDAVLAALAPAGSPEAREGTGAVE